MTSLLGFLGALGDQFGIAGASPQQPSALTRFNNQIIAQEKAASPQNIPAPLQLTNAYEEALRQGDTNRAKNIIMFAKALDKGVFVDPSTGGASALANYGKALGDIGSVKKGMERQAEKDVDLTMNPEIEKRTKAASTKAELDTKSDAAADSTLPVIDQLRQFNTKTFTMPYADTAPVRGYTRIFGDAEQQEKQKNMDLLKQARTDLAAPLAKELGVNPTDKDFQATLDRIFDSNASQESRSAQIDALEDRILKRKESRRGGLNSPKGGEVPITRDAKPPEGAVKVGTSNGKPVYKLPDGRGWMP